MKLTKTAAQRRSVLVRSLVIALCSATVISTVQCNSVGGVEPAPASAIAAKQSAPAAPEAAEAAAPKQKDQVEAKSSAATEQAKPNEPAKTAAETVAAEQTRKGRSEAPSNESKPTSQPAAEAAKSAANKPVEQKAASKPAASTSSQSKLSAKSGASSSSSGSSSSVGKKLPANLGTVTSTGSGGPAHYMSKHDAYSAIAEKHGALAQDAMRKADKRNHNLQRFSGIQKASGFSDALNPFKSVTDGGLARTLGASMRSIMKGKYSIPAYVASAVLGAVALMAFYESPISPLPVPALPEPPVGRFPPEMPVISPNLQVPFRMNQQQQQQQFGQQQFGGQQNGYANQRSFQAGLQQPSQQVLFPGATAQTAQQRQGTAAGPVQQLAANLISSVSANRQTAQRKSGSDSDLSSSRSFFGSSAQLNTNKLNAPANQQNKQPGNSLFSFLGLGGGSAQTGAAAPGSPSASSSSPAVAPLSGPLGDVHRASGLGTMASTTHDLAGSLSNSHLVNKMKSYFDRPVPHSSWSMDHNVPNQYDQYRRMSIMQALAKDTAFLSSFFTPAKRSSNSTASVNPIQQSINAVLSGTGLGGSPATAPQQQSASSRMQVDSLSVLPSLMPPSLTATPVKRASSGYGLMRAADRVAHALLDTFTSGLLHRSSESSKRSASALGEQQQQQQQQNALASATSILSDIMSSYNAAQQVTAELNNQQQQQQQQQPSLSQVDASSKQQVGSGEQASGRSADSTSSVEKPTEQVAASQPAKASPSSSSESVPEQQQASLGQQPLTRKVRSIGIDYPTLDAQQQQQQQPSRASQINNLVDFVSDSYKQNKLLFSFVMNQVGLSQALPYVDQFLGNPSESKEHQFS